MHFDLGLNVEYIPPASPSAGKTDKTVLDVPAADVPADLAPTFTPNAYVSPEWAAAMAASATADYGALPFGQFMDPHQPVYDAAAAAGLDEEGVGMMQQMAMMGQLDRMGPINRSTGEEIVWRLQSGAVSNDLAKTLMKQIIDPDNQIQQVGNHTCVAATAQKAMAQESPALYFITGADFVQSGQGNLPSGEQATISEANLATIREANLSGAELIDASFQAALMDHANAGDTYSLATDSSTRADGRVYRGLSEAQASELNSDTLSAPTLLGSNILADFEARSMNTGYIDQGEWGRQGEWGGVMNTAPPIGQVVAEHLAAARTQGFPGVFVPVADAAGARHMVLVREVDQKNNMVSLMDASGAAKTMPYWDFLNSVALTDNGANGDNGIGTLTTQAATGAATVFRARRGRG